MDNTILQAIIWVSAGGLLVMLMARRRKRKSS